MLKDTIKTYYTLAKPGIIYGNALTAVAGFLLASQGHIHLGVLLAMLGGISLVIASACVCNNYTDRGIDQLMARTKKRALVTGQVLGRNALIYAMVLLFGGVALLVVFTNLLSASIALIGFFVYVVLYGIGKRRSVHGTLVGSIAGAVPPLVGYCAVSNRVDLGGLILFMMIALWQMPHFYGIAMYRVNDYAAALLPVLPVKKGMYITKIQTLGYIAGFTVVASLLTLFGYTGYIYLITILGLGSAWFWQGVKTIKTLPDAQWGRSMFRFSLIAILVVSGILSFATFLP